MCIRDRYSWSSKIINQSDLQEVIKRQIIEPSLEKKIELNLNNSKLITNKISKKVKQQYEENPYPRWINTALHFTPISISEFIKLAELRVENDCFDGIKNPKILIAGCGTGQHSIDTASRFKNCKVLAVDLSLSSLAYAKRKTKELAIKNIKYMQADILDLSKLNKKFDIIESGGVLHHLSLIHI